MIGPGLVVLSWAAVLVGFVGTWVAGRHRSGWLYGCASAGLWLMFDLTIGVWAGAFACVVSIAIGVRNYRIGKPPGLEGAPDVDLA